MQRKGVARATRLPLIHLITHHKKVIPVEFLITHHKKVIPVEFLITHHKKVISVDFLRTRHKNNLSRAEVLQRKGVVSATRLPLIHLITHHKKVMPVEFLITHHKKVIPVEFLITHHKKVMSVDFLRTRHKKVIPVDFLRTCHKKQSSQGRGFAAGGRRQNCRTKGAFQDETTGSRRECGMSQGWRIRAVRGKATGERGPRSGNDADRAGVPREGRLSPLGRSAFRPNETPLT